MKYTTLNEIVEHRPCISGWKHLLKNLGKTKADNEPLAFKRILKSNGIEDAIWALCVLPLRKQALYRADIAESILHLFEREHPSDTRPRKAIEALRKYASGEISKDGLNAAVNAAHAVVGTARATYTIAGAGAIDASTAVAASSSWEDVASIYKKHFC